MMCAMLPPPLTTVIGTVRPQVSPPPKSQVVPKFFVVIGMTISTTYYYGIKALDEAANESGLSNIVSSITGGVATCSGGNLEMVTVDGTFNNSYDNQKRSLFQSWGYIVTAIADGAAQSTFTSVATANDLLNYPVAVHRSSSRTALLPVDSVLITAMLPFPTTMAAHLLIHRRTVRISTSCHPISV